MKGVPIKFRGTRIDGNGYAYGDISYEYNSRETWVDGWQVYPVAIAQLVGYDADGNEVYEGDKLLDQHGEVYTAVLKGFAVSDGDCIPLDFDDKNVPRLLLVKRDDLRRIDWQIYPMHDELRAEIAALKARVAELERSAQHD